MGITQLLFWFLTVMALGSALMVIFSKNPVHSILWLIVTFFSISGHYILLNAQFLAIVNMIVYAGAIMVLFLFVVMLMNLNANSEPQKNKWIMLAGTVAGGASAIAGRSSGRFSGTSDCTKAVRSTSSSSSTSRAGWPLAASST